MFCKNNFYFKAKNYIINNKLYFPFWIKKCIYSYLPFNFHTMNKQMNRFYGLSQWTKPSINVDKELNSIEELCTSVRDDLYATYFSSSVIFTSE